MKTRTSELSPSENSEQGDGDQRNGGQAGVLDEAKDAVSRTAEIVRKGATSNMESQQGRIAGQINEVAHALRRSSGHLRETETGEIASTYVDKLAEQTERFAGYLQANGPREMFSQVERFARREPAIFLGGAFTLGLVAARFLKSSGHSSRASSDRPGASASTRPQGREKDASGGARQPSKPASPNRLADGPTQGL